MKKVPGRWVEPLTPVQKGLLWKVCKPLQVIFSAFVHHYFGLCAKLYNCMSLVDEESDVWMHKGKWVTKSLKYNFFEYFSYSNYRYLRFCNSSFCSHGIRKAF